MPDHFPILQILNIACLSGKIPIRAGLGGLANEDPSQTTGEESHNLLPVNSLGKNMVVGSLSS